MRKINQLKIGSILSYTQMLLSIVIGLCYTPIMIRLLGQSEYGLYNTVSSTISMLTVLSLGFNSSYVRYFAKYKNNGDTQSIHKLNGLFLTVFCVLGAIAFACGMFLSFNLELVFDQGLTPSEYKVARVLMILLTINLASSFPMSVFTSIISANERFVFLKLLGMAKTVLGPLVTLPLLLMGYRSVAMVAVTLIVSLVVDWTYVFYVKFVMKNKFVFRGIEKGLFRDLFVFTFFISLNLIVDQVNSNMGKFLLGRFNGTVAVAVYSVGYSLYQYYLMFSTSVSGVFSPRIHTAVNETKHDLELRKVKLTDLFIKVGRIQCLVLGLLATGLVFFGKPFICWWAGNEYAEAYGVMLMLVIPSSVALIQNSGIEIQRALNKHRFRSIAYIIMALVNLIVSVILCRIYGVLGVAVGTGISLIIANGIVMNIYYHKRCSINILRFWKNIACISLGFVVPIAVGILMNIFVNLYSISNLLICVLVYTVVYCTSIWIFAMNRYEKDLILIPLSNFFEKNKNS